MAHDAPGIGAGGEYGACMSLISESFSKKQIGRASSIAGIGAQVGAALAAILAAVVIPWLGWKMLYVIGVLPVLMVLVIRRGLKEPEDFQKTRATGKTTKLSHLFETSTFMANNRSKHHGNSPNRGLFWFDELVAIDHASTIRIISIWLFTMDGQYDRRNVLRYADLWDHHG